MTAILTKLVIKPTLSCTANCPTCSLRLALYEQQRLAECITTDRWITLLKDAQEMGCDNLHISGGEPTLFPDLPVLVETAKSLGMTVNVNTNGSYLPTRLLNQLNDAGLDSITVSVYSWREAIHDEQRCEPGLFQRMQNTIHRLLNETNILVDLQTLIANYNILEFDCFLEFAYRLGVGHVYVSYLEGAVNNPFLPTSDQILAFRQNTILRAIKIIRDHAEMPHQKEALTQVQNMFSDDPKRIAAFSSGRYFEAHKPPCPRPQQFALIIANGDIHPCNGIEYCHEPVMGNARQHSLSELWNGERWQRFRKERLDWCHQCPMTLHFRIPIAGDHR